MKIQKYLKKLQSSKEFKDFMKKNSDAFLMAGFFIIDLEAGKAAHQINYFIPSKKKVAIFSVDNKIELQIVDTIGAHPSPTQLDMNTEIDLDTLPGILEDEMKNRSITDEIKKIIAIVQNIDGKKIWNLNCVLSGMNILKAHVEDASKSVLKMEKSSIMDYIQKMPMPPGAQAAGKPQIQLPGQAPAPSLSPASAQASEGNEEQPSEEQIKEEMNKLNKLEEAIEKEKSILKSEMLKEEKAKALKSEKKKARAKK